MNKILFIPLLFILACGNGSTAQDETPSTQQTTAAITKDVDAPTFQTMIAEKADAQLLDVRTPEEVAAGMIEGAQHMDFYEDNFQDQLATLDKTKPVLVYCAAGGRSGKAMDMMQKMGFNEVYNLAGGYRGWSGAGLPTSARE